MKTDFIKDRFTQGFIAGVGGWLPHVIFIYPMYGLGLTKLRYLDFAAVLTFNHIPKNFTESLIAEIIVIVFQGVLGIIFTLLLKGISSRNLYFKGWLYGTFTWFAIYATMTLYELRHIYPVDTLTAVSNLIAASVWSIGMTWTLSFLNKKIGTIG